MDSNTSRLHTVPTPNNSGALDTLKVHQDGLSEHFARLKPNATVLRFHRGDTIAAAGTTAAHIYLLSSGCLRLTHQATDGRRHIVTFLFAGDTVGLSDASVFALSIEAVSAVTLTAYPRAVFDRQGEGNNRLRADVVAHLSAAIQTAHRQIFELSILNARERVATFLLRMMQQPQLVYGSHLDLPMPRQDIADHLGLSVETVCRVLAALRTEGVIEVPNARVIVVRNPPVLRTIADSSPQP